MNVRLAQVTEAESCWKIRNLAIRYGCQGYYPAEIIAAWTPATLPDSYGNEIATHPFYVISDQDNKLWATGFLDTHHGSVEALFTHPQMMGRGFASHLLQVLKAEALARGFSRLTLSSTLNAHLFYEKQGFTEVKRSLHYSRLAQAELACVEMAITLTGCGEH